MYNVSSQLLIYRKVHSAVFGWIKLEVLGSNATELSNYRTIEGARYRMPSNSLEKQLFSDKSHTSSSISSRYKIAQ